MHECPKTDCQHIIPENWIACLDHWYTVPEEIREKVEAAQQSREYRAYLDAVQEAIHVMNYLPEADEPHVLWEECGMRCVRYGTKSDGFIQFESGLYNKDSNIVDWQEVRAAQIGLLLNVLGEHFEKARQIADRTREADYATP